ncbi:MaoC family dehydratase [Amycolatopsis sp.]|uniref:MaoC family dehydratase n=1 Tax=Amycolatopsis sp. TaxID=37632 RepID=UPI002C486DEE|nr:MaoC/PaaZ C-terminal domain-containing protein [Amycolatopsis sp.]HVV08287.1 MaoC/PaaZ C-terminal domain-containing protein [Amycolatopsis sp.]
MLPGRFYEDIPVGDEQLTPRVTVTEGHILAYAGVSGDFSALHLDETYAAGTEFGGRIAHGLLGLTLTDGLKVQSGYFRTGIALSWSWNFRGPIRIGDTLQVRFRIADARTSKSRPQLGIVTVAVELLNQRGEIVQEGEHRLMVPRRAGATQEGGNAA